jgi:parvulin-like peptidyl-prolyl isomerase
MKISGKAIAAIVVVALLGGGALLMQTASSTPEAIKLTAHDLEVIVGELMPPAQQQQLASSQEEKQEFIKFLRRMLALGQAAKQENYEQRAEIKGQLDLQTDLALVQVYRKRNPEAEVSDEETSAYFQEHPKEWDEFVEANPQIKQQGERANDIKKQLGQVKVMAERARKEGIDKEEGTRLRVLVSRSQVLAEAYRRDLQKNANNLVSDQEVEQYYNEHKAEFEEVRARHILVSTNPPEDSSEPEEKTGKKDAGKKKPAPKALTKEEARKKAQTILDRVRKGEDFTKLAKENSDDPGSKESGGDLNFFSKGDMVPQFDEVAFSLTPGQVSDLVETQFGFHIIKVEERRTASLEDAQTKEKIRQKLEQQAFEKEIDRIVGISKVEVAEDFTITPAPLPVPPPVSGPPPPGDK